ncbi:MAG TPA: HlyD family efflux transporter periplasmic adaptor subunit, partial [Polymorphobacter sp.]|nr:HlyD family efflux transporter periplasmic adaptor subunit [Polymorphobacter sp.]
VAGRLLRVGLKPGDMAVARQTVVARIQPGEPEFLNARRRREVEAQIRSRAAILASAAARVTEARAERDLADRELERMKRLRDTGFTAEAAVDRARMTHDRAEAAVLDAMRLVDSARSNLAESRALLTPPTAVAGAGTDVVTVHAPVGGSVLRVLHESESIVAAGTPLVEIGNPEQLEIVTDMLSSDAVQVRPGAAAIIDQWGGARPLRAKVRLVEPYGFTKVSALGVEEQRVNVVLDFDEPRSAWARLGHGYRVIVRIVTWSSPDVLQVPASALFREGNDWAVFVADAGRARLARIRLGAMNPDSAAIVTGLRAGDKVVLHPGDKVTDGARIVERAD